MRSKSVIQIGIAALMAIALALGGSAPAHAAGGGAKKNAEMTKKEPSVPSVSMPMLVAPVMIRGQLVRYVFLHVALILPDDSNKMMLLEKIPYIQDEFLREVHSGTIVLGEDPNALDQEGLGARLLARCVAIVGPDIVKKVDFRDSTKDFR